MSLRYTKDNVVLWVVVAASAVFIVLWGCGIRVFRFAPSQPPVAVEVEEEDAAGPMPPLNRSSRAFDIEQPKQPEDVNDGRDPVGVLL